MSQYIQPGWFTFEGASAYCGLSVSTIQMIVSRNLVISSNVRMPGNTRGRRLIKRESLDAFIEQGIGQVTELRMNHGFRKRRRA